MKDTRVSILETAYSLFMQNGYKAVTMNDIVRQTGLSKGAFYHYFSSKEHLFEEVVNHVFFGDFTRDYVNMPLISLRHFMEDELDMVKRRHDTLMGVLPSEDKYVAINHYTLVFDALRILPDFKIRFETYKADRLNAWVRIIEKAKTTREIRTDMAAEDFARLFIYVNQGVGMSFIMGNNLCGKQEEIAKLWHHLYALVGR